MNKELRKKLIKSKKEYLIRKKWLRITVSLCVLVACVTTYIFIKPASTAENEIYCGFEEHVHDESCYGLKLMRTGGQSTPSEYFVYTPSDRMTPSEAHMYTPSEYDISYELDYSHPICGMQVHHHTLQCFSDPYADIEDEYTWERMFENLELTGNFNEDVLSVARTQLGYSESTRNYEVQEDGVTMNGYTRYGDWYGDPYGEWCAMFCSFCLHYAGVSEDIMPYETSSQNWIDLLGQPEYDLYREANAYVPVPGDLVFFDRDTFDPQYPELREADHVGFVSELIYDEETNELIKIKTIEGNSGDRVSDENEYDLTDTAILGYSMLPENPAFLKTIESAPASDGAVAVITGNLPDGAEAFIEAVYLTDEQLVMYFGQAQAAQMKGYAAYDIKIMVDGVEWQPDENVKVVVKQNALLAEEDQSFGVAHVDDSTNEISDVKGAIADDGEITFRTDGFSLYIFYTFTVDFHFGDLTFSIAGMDSILLSELFRALGIDLDATDAVSVVFSEPLYLKVERMEDGDWLLTSLAPFTSFETLTITFSDERVLVINVTDAQGDAVNPCDQYLDANKANAWQVVTPYTGNAVGNKTQAGYDNGTTFTPIDLDGDGKDDAWLQKNVVPTGVENEFYVYLSIAKPISAEMYLKNATLHVAATNNSAGLGSLSSSLPGSYKGDIGPETNNPTDENGALWVKISIYETATWNGSKWIGNGKRLSYFEGWRECPGNVGCNNGSIYLKVNINGNIQYLKLANETNLGKNKRGSGNPFEIILGYDKLSNQGVYFDKTETKLNLVTDIIGSQMEFVCDDASIVYCDGTVDYNGTDASGNRILSWTPEESFDNAIFVGSTPYKGIYNNVSQLVYKVRLKTETEGFKSCASNMNSTVTDPESYKVNESATLDYSRVSLTGANPPYYYNFEDEAPRAEFPVPYVRGLLYDLWFEKVDESENPLPGAKFKLKLDDGSYLQDDAGNDRIFESDENGLVGLFDLPQGQYTGVVGVEETVAPPFYEIPDGNPWTIPLNYTVATDRTVFTSDSLHEKPGNMRYTALPGSTDEWKIVNTRKPGVKVKFKKVSAEDGITPVSGVTFALYGSETSETPLAGYEALISGSDGIFSPENCELPAGTYYLKEVASPGYKKLTDAIKIIVTVSPTNSVTVEATGTDPKTSGNPIVSGPVAGVYTVTVENEPSGQPVVFKKVDNKGTAVEGAKFELYGADESGNIGAQIPSDKPTSDENGSFLSDISRLNAGTYYLREVEVPKEYKKLTNDIKIVVTDAFSIAVTVSPLGDKTAGDPTVSGPDTAGIYTITVKNEPKPKQAVKFVKVDSVSEAAVKGAKFALYDSDEEGNKSDQPMTGYDNLTSDENGIFSLSNMMLIEGTYYLTEKTAPADYGELTDDIKIVVSADNVTVSAVGADPKTSGSPSVSGPVDGVYTVTVENVLELVDIQIVKIDSARETATLAGAEFDLYIQITKEEYDEITDDTLKKEYTDPESNVQYLKKINNESLVSGDDGIIKVEKLRMGTYWLFETKAPDGYNILEAPVMFKLGLDTDSSKPAIASPSDADHAVLDEENVLTLKIKNQSGYELPSTGGIGASLFWLLGTILIAGGAVLLSVRKHIIAE